MEDDYGMIDGIINNGERSKDKEPEWISPLSWGSSLRPKRNVPSRKPPELGKPGKDEPEL